MLRLLDHVWRASRDTSTLTKCIACATNTEVVRYKTMISTSASGERIHLRNLTPGGWPATEAPQRSWSHNENLLVEAKARCFFALHFFNRAARGPSIRRTPRLRRRRRCRAWWWRPDVEHSLRLMAAAPRRFLLPAKRATSRLSACCWARARRKAKNGGVTPLLLACHHRPAPRWPPCCWARARRWRRYGEPWLHAAFHGLPKLPR